MAVDGVLARLGSAAAGLSSTVDGARLTGGPHAAGQTLPFTVAE
jgi:hypothetical protein